MTQVLFDNYDGYDFDDIKAGILEANDLDDCSDNEVYDTIAELEQEDWDYCKALIESACSDGQIIVRGQAGTWTWEREAMQIYESLHMGLPKILRDCDYIKVWTDGSHLYIRASHHDGTNQFEIKVVTTDGERYYHNWNYSYDPRTENLDEWQILDRMWKNSKYSKLPKKIVW